MTCRAKQAVAAELAVVIDLTGVAISYQLIAVELLATIYVRATGAEEKSTTAWTIITAMVAMPMLVARNFQGMRTVSYIGLVTIGIAIFILGWFAMWKFTYHDLG